jgi:hypothetical protein
LSEKKLVSSRERFADSFAKHFLMPASGLNRPFTELHRATSELFDPETPAFPGEPAAAPRKARIQGSELMRRVATDRHLSVEKREAWVCQWSVDASDSRMHGCCRALLF